MRLFGASAALAVALAAAGPPAPAAAEGAERCRPGVATVRAAGRPVWCAPDRHVALATDPIWSRNRRAVAFVTEGRRGELTLVVVLVGGAADGHAMRWPVPEEAGRSGRRGSPRVTWLAEDRVGFGFSPVRPALVASWRLRRL